MVRLSQFTDGLRKGWSPEIAAGYTKEVHFDYRDLSNFENNVMRRLFPWYAFVNKNLPFNIRMQTGQMNKYAWFHHAYSNWWKANPFTEEEDYENGGSLPSPKDMASWQSRYGQGGNTSEQFELFKRIREGTGAGPMPHMPQGVAGNAQKTHAWLNEHFPHQAPRQGTFRDTDGMLQQSQQPQMQQLGQEVQGLIQ